MTVAFARFRPAVPFKFWLVATSALASCSIFAPESALAQTFTAGNYPSGISVPSNHTPINVTLDSGVQVVPPVGSNVPIAVGLDSTNGSPGTGGGSITLIAPAVTITTTNTLPPPSFTAGLYTLADGDSFVGTPLSPVAGMITVTGGEKTKGIWSQTSVPSPRI